MRKVVTYLLFLALAVPAWAQPFTLTREKDKLYLEIPDSLMGRRVLLSSYLRSSSNPSLPVGSDISTTQAYRLAKTDSLILFLRPSSPVHSADSAVLEALRNSHQDAIQMALPIHKRNQDSLSCTVDIGKLLDPSNKAVISLKGRSYDNSRIQSASHKKDLMLLLGTTAYPQSVGVLRSLTYELKLTGMLGMELAGTYKFSGEVETCLTLLPESTLSPLKADERIGVRTVTYPGIETGAQGYRRQEWASRWNLEGGKMIDIYVDTLLAQPWYDAVERGILAWNKAFEQAGMGARIRVQRYPAQNFQAQNPLVSTVYTGNGGNVSATLNTDPSTGEILSVSISIPTGFVDAVRKEGMVYISDVDPRYQSYNLCTEAVAEYLQAKVMSVFGLGLGLTRNLAGSHAYSPEQLRDPAFTQAHGISSSVTDALSFNVLARPGDKERGVVTISSQIGAYDAYAIRWLYDNTLDRDAWIAAHNTPEYLFLAQNNLNPDPRGLANDLGNDPFELYNTVQQRLRWVATHAAAWIDKEEVPQDYKDLFADYVFLGQDRISNLLSRQVGAVMMEPRREGSAAPKFTTTPPAVQKAVIQRLYQDWSNLTWLEEDKALLTLAGANVDVSTFSRMNAWAEMRLAYRFNLLAMAQKVADNAYPLQDALADIEKLLTSKMLSGETLSPGEEMMIAHYAAALRLRSPLMTAQAKEADHNQLSFTLSGIPVLYVQETEATCYQALLHLKKTLEKARGRQSREQRARVDYLLNIVNHSINQ